MHKAEILQILKREQAEPAPAINEAPAPSPNAHVLAAPAAKPAPPAPEAISPVAAEPWRAGAPATPSFKHDEEPTIAASAAEEIKRLEAEIDAPPDEEEGRRAEVEVARLSAENALRTEQARWRQQEEETARRRAQKESSASKSKSRNKRGRTSSPDRRTRTKESGGKS